MGSLDADAMTPRQIATNQSVTTCDVCHRTLLRGERSDVFLAGGSRRLVCELCTPRAAHEGWIREGVGDDGLVMRQRRDRGAGLLDRLRARRGDHGVTERRRVARAAADEPLEAPALPYGENGGSVPLAAFEPEAVAPEPEAPRVPAADPFAPAAHERQVRAIPTNADMKRARAVELFNASAHPRTLSALARSLGAPFVTVRPSDTEGSIVSIVAGWELTWYRFEVDLANEAAGVRVAAQGDEVGQLDEADRRPNAAATDGGELVLVEAPA